MELKPLSSVSSGDGQCHILFLNIMLRIEILCVRLLQIVLDSGSFKSLFLLLALGYNVLVPGVLNQLCWECTTCSFELRVVKQGFEGERHGNNSFGTSWKLCGDSRLLL